MKSKYGSRDKSSGTLDDAGSTNLYCFLFCLFFPRREEFAEAMEGVGRGMFQAEGTARDKRDSQERD